MKNGLPPVFCWMTSASGMAVAASWCRVSATNSATSGTPSGASSICCTGTPCFACSLTASMNGWFAATSLSRYVSTSSSDSVARADTIRVMRFRLAESAHCMSSRNSTSGCDFLQNTCTKFWNARLKAILGLESLELRHARLRAR